MVTNLVNKPGQTDNWHVADYVKEVEKYVGSGQIDYVLYNNHLPSKHLLKKYAEKGELPLQNKPSRFQEIQAQPIGARLVSKEIYVQDKNDTLHKRTLIRHDPIAVCRELITIMKN
jgi:2-phospho-L-lactate transferase/gluconeogenesis factor (CofD/UPF0052 family)